MCVGCGGRLTFQSCQVVMAWSQVLGNALVRLESPTRFQVLENLQWTMHLAEEAKKKLKWSSGARFISRTVTFKRNSDWSSQIILPSMLSCMSLELTSPASLYQEKEVLRCYLLQSQCCWKVLNPGTSAEPCSFHGITMQQWLLPAWEPAQDPCCAETCTGGQQGPLTLFLPLPCLWQ